MLASSQAQTTISLRRCKHSTCEPPSPHPLPTCVSSETGHSHRHYCWGVTGIPVVPGVTKKLELRDTTSTAGLFITVPNDLRVNITLCCAHCNLPLAGVIKSTTIKWWRGHIPFRCVIKRCWLGYVQIVREDQWHHESDIYTDWFHAYIVCVFFFFITSYLVNWIQGKKTIHVRDVVFNF